MSGEPETVRGATTGRGHRVVTPPLVYYGGKARLAERIAALLPAHQHYVEPFAGSLAVLLAKNPSPFETVNDLDGALMGFWRVLRDRPIELALVCALTPHSRGEHQRAYVRGGVDEVEQARRVWVALTQGRGATLRRTGWRHFQNPAVHGPMSMAAYLSAYVTRMPAAAARLAKVSLEARSALEVIADYGRHEQVCLYADPPYLGSTRSSRQYQHEMSSDAEHARLAEALHQCRAAVVISGYPSALYEDLYAGWHRVELTGFTGQAHTAGRRVEVLWSNRPFATTPAGPAPASTGCPPDGDRA